MMVVPRYRALASANRVVTEDLNPRSVFSAPAQSLGALCVACGHSILTAGPWKDCIGPTEKPIGDQARTFVYGNTEGIPLPDIGQG
jgi:hypothetical protein